MLKVENLSVQYAAFKALHGVSLSVEDGLIVSIVGANGAGKSTLINAISGMIRPKEGRVTFDGETLSTMAPHDVVRLGVVQVPEGRKLFPDLSVFENLLVGGSHKRAKAERSATIEEVYDLFPVLKERNTQLARTLSGGEQQMLAIGRAMMSKPKLLMMDEPSLGLAPIVVQSIFGVVKELKRRGLTILLVEQNIRHSLQISDYAYVLETGQVVLEGTGQEVLADEHTTAAYIGTA
ncbi:MAG: ABC transporter ATP-binding protein [Thermoleophilia bacterium]|nr:ABC transporter ATP-binding protein [Thermoleophilia bacterium]